MIAVSNDFKRLMKEPIKQLSAYIKVNENESITNSDDLISIKVSCDTSMCKASMRKLEAKYLGEHNLLDKWVNVGFGVLNVDKYNYLDYGTFQITEISTSKDTGVTSITGYDRMINSMKPYIKLNVTYPMGLYDYTKALLNSCGLELGNESFEINNDLIVDKELWENIDGITYRDIMQQIAQVTGTVCIIRNDDKVYFKRITDTKEQLTYSNLFKLKLEPIYGPINSVILSRTPQEDNIYKRDEESITTNGLTEYKIENNEFVDKDRDTYVDFIYNAFHGISYYPFEVSTEGLGWYEIGDKVDVINDTGDKYNCVIFNYSITVDGGIKETLKATAETKTQTQYQYASPVIKRIKNTEIIVDKQGQNITQLVSDMYGKDGIVSENFTKVFQDINNVTTSIQSSGGGNLIKNSVMFAYDDKGNPNDWEVSGDGTLSIQSSAEALASGSLSGHIFTLLNKKVVQRVYVKVDNNTISEEEKVYYSFSTKIKKDATGSCYVKLSNSNEEHLIQLKTGESSFYGDYELKELLPKDTYYDIEFYGSEDSNATFTDNMFALGKYKTQWQQASTEIMNTQVNINVDGVLVKSSIYDGDYTVMSPLEFAGYSKINGVITKVFSLNKDTTEVKKLKSSDEISMYPIKIVPITSGDLQGWAFVPTSGGDN